MSWLVISIVLSVLITVILNAGLRLFPDAGNRAARRVSTSTWPTAEPPRPGDRRVRMWMPWKAMILGSVMLTVVLNVVLWITRA